MRTRRSIPLAAAALAALAAALPQHAGAVGFRYGVTAAEVTSSSALLWSRADRSGPVILQVDRTRSTLGPSCPRSAVAPVFTGRVSSARVPLRRELSARAANDRTVQTTVGGLEPGTTYYYRFCRRGLGRSSIGRFTTAPAATSARTITFAYSGDADASRRPGESRPFFNNFEVYRRMQEEGNHFNVNFGDTIYSDTGVSGRAPALSVAGKWRMYRQNIEMKNLRRLRQGTGLYNHWDDDEFINDFSIPEHGRSLYRNGVQAFRDYQPVTYTGSDGIYRSFRWGRNLEVFFLDQRSFRDAKASEGGTCDNPQTGEPDLAPTAPQERRDFFALLVPSLSEPVSQECLDRIRDPERTFLGRRQYERFTEAVKRSTATFKVIMNETPIQQFYALPYDRWEGYEAERKRLLRYLRDEVKNVIFLTTDTHANFVNDARLRTLEEGGPKDTGILDVVTGPVATNSYRDEIDQETGAPGSGAAISAAFFKPPPPQGVGMQCSATDVYSYAQVTVTSTRLTVQAKDLNGDPVVEDDGTPCGPFTILRE